MIIALSTLSVTNFFDLFTFVTFRVNLKRGENMSNFSDTLVYLRKRDGLSQQELANKMNVSRSLIGMFESGQRMPSIEVLETIADTFNVGIDFLIGRVDSGKYSAIFRKNLSSFLDKCEPSDIAATGIDKYETNLIIEGAISLSLDCACRISNQLGEPLDTLLGIERHTPVSESGPSEEELRLISLYRELNLEGQEKLLDYADDLVSSGKYIKSDSDKLGKTQGA